jgi:hypothetical protein
MGNGSQSTTDVINLLLDFLFRNILCPFRKVYDSQASTSSLVATTFSERQLFLMLWWQLFLFFLLAL